MNRFVKVGGAGLVATWMLLSGGVALAGEDFAKVLENARKADVKTFSGAMQAVSAYVHVIKDSKNEALGSRAKEKLYPALDALSSSLVKTSGADLHDVAGIEKIIREALDVMPDDMGKASMRLQRLNQEGK